MNDYSVAQTLLNQYRAVRQQTQSLCHPLATEDYIIQSMEDVSPPKWHLAHTTWFFESFILIPHFQDYQVFDVNYHYLFNSYYHSIGNIYPRSKRGILSRPTVNTIYAYRKYVDSHMLKWMEAFNHHSAQNIEEIHELLTLGIHHEQQHQELLLMDIKYNFFNDPTYPIYLPPKPKAPPTDLTPIQDKKLDFIYYEGGTINIGGNTNHFCFDNELPSHAKILPPFMIAPQLVTNQEYLEFIEEGGYQNPLWWLADGWDHIQQHQWQAPLYWLKQERSWHLYTLSGVVPLDPTEPVAHVSFYEANAFALWKRMRLPLEEEWEHAAYLSQSDIEQGNFLENEIFHPTAAPQKTESLPAPQQLFGDLWEWTASAYLPYPKFTPKIGALGEYNGKFMNNQMVLRGGACTTPRSHIRASYRNFYHPGQRWHFSGIRLARDVKWNY